MTDKARCVLLSPLGPHRKWTAASLSWLIFSFIIIHWIFPFPASASLFVSLPLSASAEVFAYFHLCEDMGFTVCKVSGNAATPALNIVWPRWKWKQNVQNILPLCFLSSGSRCQTLPGLNALYSSVFFADDHPDCPQCFSHMMVVIQLVTESAPKPSQCRLAQEKYRVGDSISTRAFPASCSFNRASL